MPPELVPWLAVFAFVLGIIALVLEIFVVTGFGIVGVAGIIFIGWGIFLLSVDVTHAFKALVVALVISILLFILGIRLMTKVRLWKRFALESRQSQKGGYNASRSELVYYTGKEGMTITPLRPAGAIEIDGERLDVVSEGGFIPAGAKVRVIKVDSSRIVVRSV